MGRLQSYASTVEKLQVLKYIFLLTKALPRQCVCERCAQILSVQNFTSRTLDVYVQTLPFMVGLAGKEGII